MKRIRLIFLMLLIFNSIQSQIPTALNIRVGDSELKGLVGVEYQRAFISISGGWRPLCTPEEVKINSFSSALTFYNKYWYESSYYISCGMATNGIMYQTENWTYKPSNSFLILIGYKSVYDTINITNRFNITVGVGCNVNKRATLFAFEVLLNFNIL